MPKPILALALLLALCFLPAAASAAPNADSFVKDKQSELSGLLKQGGKSNDKKIDGIFDEMLDYDALAEESLKDYWGDRSDAEKKEFKEVLKRLVRNAYKKNLKKTLDYSIEYKGQGAGKKGYVVRTVAKSKTNKREDPVSIDYVMHKVDGKWRVKDIVTEGSSLVNNYRSQFRRIIKKKGFDDLMSRMKKKLDKEGA